MMTAAEARALTKARREETRVEQWLRTAFIPRIQEAAGKGWTGLVPSVHLFRHRDDPVGPYKRDVKALCQCLEELGYKVGCAPHSMFPDDGWVVEVSW